MQITSIFFLIWHFVFTLNIDLGLAKFFILWKSLCMMKPKECLSLKGVCFVVVAAAAGRELLELSRSRECGRGDSDGKTTII